MSGQMSHAINSAIGGNGGWPFSRQVGTGFARATGLRLQSREATDLAHSTASVLLFALRRSGVSWEGAIGRTLGLSMLFWVVGRGQA